MTRTIKKIVKYSLCVLIVIVSLWLIVCFNKVVQLQDTISYTPPFSSIKRSAGISESSNVSFDQLPPSIVIATLVAEDIEFPVHYGFRPRKTYYKLIRYLFTEEKVSAGSSITQQVAKNLFTDANRSLIRKAVELVYSLMIELLYTKEEIFTLYANIAQTSENVFGYQSAARFYFNKDIQDITFVEGVFIVNNLPSPIKRSAWFSRQTPDATVFLRITNLLKKSMILEARIPGEITHNSQIFAALKTPEILKTISFSDERAIEEKARKLTKAFALSHWRDSQHDLGIVD